MNPLIPELREPILRLWDRLYREDQVNAVFTSSQIISLLNIAVYEQGLESEYGQILIDATTSINMAILKLSKPETYTSAFAYNASIIANLAAIVFDRRMGIVGEGNQNKGRLIDI